jgi:hypothetical protein
MNKTNMRGSRPRRRVRLDFGALIPRGLRSIGWSIWSSLLILRESGFVSMSSTIMLIGMSRRRWNISLSSRRNNRRFKNKRKGWKNTDLENKERITTKTSNPHNDNVLDNNVGAADQSTE